jgi:hypothetical protein
MEPGCGIGSLSGGQLKLHVSGLPESIKGKQHPDRPRFEESGFPLRAVRFIFQ